jgi:hypothetical protein
MISFILALFAVLFALKDNVDMTVLFLGLSFTATFLRLASQALMKVGGRR